MGKAHVHLIQADHSDWHVKFPGLHDMEPLALEVLAGSIRDIADVEIHDARSESERQIVEKTKDGDIVGVSTGHVGQVNPARRLLKGVGEKNPKALRIVGGAHATLRPGDYKNSDVVCIGSGTEALREILETEAYQHRERLEEVNGLFLTESHTQTPKRTHMGFGMPDRSLIGDYQKLYDDQAIVITSKGCPHRCRYCVLPLLTNGRYIQRPIGEIVNELNELDPNVVFMGDDNTFVNYNRMMDLAREIESQGIDKKYIGYARTDDITRHPELFEKWRNIGLSGLVVGYEAVSDSGLEAFGKGSTREINDESIQVLRDLGIMNLAHFVIRNDFSNEDFSEVGEYVEENGIMFPFFVPLTPIPGAPLYEEAKEDGLIKNDNYDLYNFEYMPMETTEMPKREWYEEFVGLWVKSYRIGKVAEVPRYASDWSALVRNGTFFTYMAGGIQKGMKALERKYERQLREEEHL